jgi:hypothetical protein
LSKLSAELVSGSWPNTEMENKLKVKKMKKICFILKKHKKVKEISNEISFTFLINNNLKFYKIVV